MLQPGCVHLLEQYRQAAAVYCLWDNLVSLTGPGPSLPAATLHAEDVCPALGNLVCTSNSCGSCLGATVPDLQSAQLVNALHSVALLTEGLAHKIVCEIGREGVTWKHHGPQEAMPMRVLAEVVIVNRYGSSQCDHALIQLQRPDGGLHASRVEAMGCQVCKSAALAHSEPEAGRGSVRSAIC